MGIGLKCGGGAAQVPRLTQAQRDAIHLFDELAASPELALTGRLEPGDIQLLNNYTILHARSAFTNHLEVCCCRRPDRPALWCLVPDASFGLKTALMVADVLARFA